MAASEVWKILRTLKDKRKLEPYIQYIRFPYFKNIEEGLKIEFNFPLTVLVGQNGTNKSSVLRAIYGCPEDKNIGNFWFSTCIDPIAEDGGRPRFIYSYYQPEAKRNVEVIKTRIQRVYGSKKGQKTKKINPDYWEPSRPLISDGMAKMPEDGKLEGRTKTRWKLMKKDVIFMDFRSEISAFDKCFYHGDLKQTLRHNSKQDFIRSKSIHIKGSVDNNLTSKKMYRGRKEHILRNVILPDEQKKHISHILGREYTQIRILGHSFFKSVGETIILQTADLSYSEAFAGSGEFSVVMLVNKISEASHNSLIILDEPEVSLHPGAQERLVGFLLERIKNDKHQIVIGTHSPFIIKELPAEAIKTLYNDPASSKIKVINKTLPEEAFFHLGVKEDNRRTIFVEDRLAGAVVKKALRSQGQAIDQSFSIKYMPGGATVLLTSYLPAYALTERVDSLFVMDGDQMPEQELNQDDDLSFVTDTTLEGLVSSLLRGTPAISVDGGNGGPREDQLRDSRIKIVEYSRKYLRYLPEKTPEKFIWENMSIDITVEFDTYGSYKDKFRALTEKELGRANYEGVTADEIFQVQQRYLAAVNDQELGVVVNHIVEFLGNQG